jgi:4-hydroxy-tetrahydrodipicolinate synthase
MNIKEKYCGVIVPMLTPLNENLDIDKGGVENIVHEFMQNNCNAFVLGTTGESSSIPIDKKIDLVKYTVEAVKGKNLVYAGISGNCLQECIDNAKQFADIGADVLVAHLPSYYPINEKQMLNYFEKLADAVPLPLMIYNIPVTTNLSMPISLVDKLSHHEKIVGFKDSERGDERLSESLNLWKNREDFTFHLGWAAMSSYGLQNGLDGIVPSSANLVPQLYRKIYDSVKTGDIKEADRIQEITDIISAYYQQGNILSEAFPIFKAMMKSFGLCEPYVASPMINLSQDELKGIKSEVLAKFGEFKN